MGKSPMHQVLALVLIDLNTGPRMVIRPISAQGSRACGIETATFLGLCLQRRLKALGR